MVCLNCSFPKFSSGPLSEHQLKTLVFHLQNYPENQTKTNLSRDKLLVGIKLPSNYSIHLVVVWMQFLQFCVRLLQGSQFKLHKPNLSAGALIKQLGLFSDERSN